MSARKLPPSREHKGVTLTPDRVSGGKFVVKFMLDGKPAVTTVYSHPDNAFAESVRRIDAPVRRKVPR